MKHIKKFFICLLIGLSTYATQTTLLIKIPTRSRPHQFFKNLDTYYQHLSYTVPYAFLITCDEDDESMNNPDVIRRLNNYPNLYFSFSKNNSKVDAFNKDVEKITFAAVLVAHDDMEVIAKNFDRVIVETMAEHFPDLDGVLNFNDGFVGGQCNTLPVIGRNFYKRFGYIYHPDYKALVCNVELTAVSKILRKEKVIDSVIIRHNHPAWSRGKKDALYDRSEQYHAKDLDLFARRRTNMFDLLASDVTQATPKMLSILICTLDEREHEFGLLCDKLKKQCKECSVEQAVEILSFKDKRGEHTVGYKRNTLLAESQGEYVCFLDDDDDVSDDYIRIMCEKLVSKPDCVSLIGIITCNGKNPQKFIHSIKYDHYFEQDSVYYRPPNHLNPIKRSIAVQFSFPEKNFGEDTDWAMAVARSQLLKKEEGIEKPYYFYRYKDK